ncbi:MAG: polyribonucleotide nucleotidyltransferase [Candidatus Treponema excrementipullorum]|nr:polyribonucleotide nucleotidyltransferase [Spirochaetia bacterium]MDD7012994.1 polyribonucleotide nucleotidyltransferase [Candidatus Treponema excrementipullorum]MCI6953688.1 polyribonucleotide nucleotidyltransferase [Spirochaetia bacterium]MCI7589484.1 polyribonucleotide nucleotidyltransferase [Spirochaetia bacterium]MDY2756722.1 polyribonucleotide nucleotidyltransferase [Candidatus Treponema excrementipullorum]
MVHRVSYKIGDQELILETGRLAKQANGAVYAQFGGSAVIATVCASGTAQEGLDFVPVTVDYNEKYYAAGKIPGGFIKREGRPKDKEILVSRLIDRPMRPLFEVSFGREIQIVPTCVSSDQVNPPDILAVIASSAAVVISDIPFNGPVAGVRVAYVDGEYVLNPTYAQMEKAQLEIVVAGTAEGFTMVEGGANEVSEEIMLGALAKAQDFITAMCHLQDELRAKAGKEKLPLCPSSVVLENKDAILAEAMPKMEEACFVKGKQLRHDAIAAVKEEVAAKYAEQLEDEMQKKLFNGLFEDMEYNILRKSILERGIRVDGRGTEDIRPITCEINVLPRPHGSAIFTRGETQSLAVATLGTVLDEQVYDDIDGDRREHFILHYNFPPYSVGEVGRMGTGRREIGHGNLARRSLEPMVPSRDEFPYTVRVVSEIMESNGSSSMASVCGGTLCMLAAGVPMKKPVAGIAMGLITEGDSYEKYAILSDILGEEDHLGDMDFKVAGTEDGITGFQMDIKIAGVTTEIMEKALAQAKRGRLHILGIMKETISAPAPKVSEYAPKIETMKIDVDKIGALIGPGGKTIKGISATYGVTVNTEDDGTVTIYGKTGKATDDAKAAIKAIVEDPEVGTIYQGTVKRIMDFGAFVEILPGKEGLCHISKLSRKRVEKVTDVLKEGQQIPVKLIEVDKMGRLNLSYIDAIEE